MKLKHTKLTGGNNMNIFRKIMGYFKLGGHSRAKRGLPSSQVRQSLRPTGKTNSRHSNMRNSYETDHMIDLDDDLEMSLDNIYPLFRDDREDIKSILPKPTSYNIGGWDVPIHWDIKSADEIERSNYNDRSGVGANYGSGSNHSDGGWGDSNGGGADSGSSGSD